MPGALRRHPLLPALLLALLLPALLFPEAWLAGGVVSADDHLSVHSAFAATSEEEAPGGVRHPHLSDPALQFAALRLRTVQGLAAGRAPLWNPDLFGGAPLLADMSSQPLSPVTLLRLVAPEDLAQDLGVAWILAWTALGSALLVRRLGAGPWGAAVAVAAAGTAPYTHAWLLHPQAATFAWVPWLCWAVERSRGIAVALCVAGLVAGGHPGSISNGLALAAGWWLLRRRDAAGPLGLALGLLLSAPLWAPFVELLRQSTDLAHRRGNTLAPVQLLDLLWPGWLGHPARNDWTGQGMAWIDGQLHPGLATLGLALAALRSRAGRGLWAAWALAVGVALVGVPGPGNHARLASEAAWLLALAAGLALPRHARWKGGGAAVLAVLLTGAWARRDDQGVLPAERHDPPPAAWVTALRAEVGCDPPDGPRCGRVLGLAHALQPDLPTRLGLRDLRGYDLPVAAHTEQLMAALDPRLVRPWFPVQDPPPAPLLDLAGVRALVSPWPIAARADLVPWDQPAPDAVYLRPSAAPRAWLAPAPRAASSPEQALAMAATGSLDRPPVEGLPGAWPHSGEITPLSPHEPAPEQVELEVAPPAPAVLVLADAWAPGWQVEVDGRPAPLLRVAGAFRGVQVGPGDRRVVFRYQPAGWTTGLRLGGLGLFLLVVAALWRRPASISSR
ncbi:YfhO family protein [Myxococcota bacterium]|nr:YfhO family protein [Myxococcota bacterium]